MLPFVNQLFAQVHGPAAFGVDRQPAARWTAAASPETVCSRTRRAPAFRGNRPPCRSRPPPAGPPAAREKSRSGSPPRAPVPRGSPGSRTETPHPGIRRYGPRRAALVRRPSRGRRQVRATEPGRPASKSRPGPEIVPPPGRPGRSRGSVARVPGVVRAPNAVPETGDRGGNARRPARASRTLVPQTAARPTHAAGWRSGSG